MFYSGDNIGAVVADIGSHSCRIGFAGEDSPRAYLPTAIGVTIDESNPTEVKHTFAPHKYTPGVQMKFPTYESIPSDWDLLERLWDFSLENFLKVDLAGMPVLVAEKPYNTPELRQKTCEMMFEKYNTSAFFLAKDATLACYACGKTTGLVIDAGASGTLITPIADGWAELKGLMKSPVGGRLMDAHMSNLIAKRLRSKPRPLYRVGKGYDAYAQVVVSDIQFAEPVHPSFDAYMNLELARDIKETVCQVADQSLSEAESRYAQAPSIPYELPDGTVIETGLERVQVPELFFDPTLVDDIELERLYSATNKLSPVMPVSSDSLSKLVVNSIARCDVETHPQAQMLLNIVLSGGNSGYKGLQERLKYEVEGMNKYAQLSGRVRVVAASEVTDKGKNVFERAICPWLGGSIMGSMGSFHEMWISKKEYDEYGPNIVGSKCP